MTQIRPYPGVNSCGKEGIPLNPVPVISKCREKVVCLVLGVCTLEKRYHRQTLSSRPGAALVHCHELVINISTALKIIIPYGVASMCQAWSHSAPVIISKKRKTRWGLTTCEGEARAHTRNPVLLALQQEASWVCHLCHSMRSST